MYIHILILFRKKFCESTVDLDKCAIFLENSGMYKTTVPRPWGDKKLFLEFLSVQFFSKRMPFLHKIGFFVIFFIFLWICIPQLPPNVVSHCCHQMLYTAAPRPNVVTWIKKMIFEGGGGGPGGMIFGGFIHPCKIKNFWKLTH